MKMEKTSLMRLINLKILKMISKMYKDNTKTTLKKDKVQEINNNEIEELKRKGRPSTTIERNVNIPFELFAEQVSGSLDEKENFTLTLSIIWMILVVIILYKHFDSSIGKNVIETKFDLVEGARVMLRTNNIHKMLKNGSLGEVVKINIKEVYCRFSFC